MARRRPPPAAGDGRRRPAARRHGGTAARRYSGTAGPRGMLAAAGPGTGSTAAVEVAAAAAVYAGAPPRQRSMLVVALHLRPRHESGCGAADKACEQARLTLMALCLALMIAPLAVLCEPVVALLTGALPGIELSTPCQNLLSERRSVDVIVTVALGAYLSLNGCHVAAVEANEKAVKAIKHTLSVGAATAVLYSAWYAASMPSSPSGSSVVAHDALCLQVVFGLPYISLAVWSFATARRRSWRRVLLDIAKGLLLSALNASLGLLIGLYVYISYQVSGLEGVVVSGKHCLRDAPTWQSKARLI
jgi:hypothetical protein